MNDAQKLFIELGIFSKDVFEDKTKTIRINSPQDLIIFILSHFDGSMKQENGLIYLFDSGNSKALREAKKSKYWKEIIISEYKYFYIIGI